MTTGALLFAFNNEQTDYVKMAAWSARRIRHHLGIPVALVTDSHTLQNLNDFEVVITHAPGTGGSRYFEDYDSTVTWYNHARVDAFELTPWDYTLLLDADYVVDSDQLRCLFNTDRQFLCHRSAIDMSTGTVVDGLDTFGRYQLPMYWATVVLFRKSNISQYIFDCMRMIRNNWDHYRDLYAIDQRNYRNDYALSIALGIVNGHTQTVDEIPWPLQNVMPHVRVERLAQSWTLEYQDTCASPKIMCFSQSDFHAMGKSYLEKIIETD